MKNYFGKDCYFVEENGGLCIQNISDYTDAEVDIIDGYMNKKNDKMINGFTWEDTIDFLNSHIECEHIYIDIKDKGYQELIELSESELCNLADSFGLSNLKR